MIALICIRCSLARCPLGLLSWTQYEGPIGCHMLALIGYHMRALIGYHMRALIGYHMRALFGCHMRALFGCHIWTLIGYHMKALIWYHMRALFGYHMRALIWCHIKALLLNKIEFKIKTFIINVNKYNAYISYNCVTIIYRMFYSSRAA